jgi:hypothetical protein
MFFKVSDVSVDYEPGEEVVTDRIEADTAEDAIVAALSAISPDYIADLLRSDAEGVSKYILPGYVAEPVA